MAAAKKARVVTLAQIGPVCGQCRHYMPHDAECGDCRESPPTWQMDSNDEVISGWPIVEIGDFCSIFAPKQ